MVKEEFELVVPAEWPCPLSRALNGTWNVDASRGESSRKIQTFISRLSLLPPDDKSKVWREWIVIHFEFSQFVNWKNYPCPKLLSLHIFLRVQFASWAAEQILGEEFLGKSTHLAAAAAGEVHVTRLPPERTKAFFFPLLNFFTPWLPPLVALVWFFDFPLRVVLGLGTF